MKRRRSDCDITSRRTAIAARKKPQKKERDVDIFMRTVGNVTAFIIAEIPSKILSSKESNLKGSVSDPSAKN